MGAKLATQICNIRETAEVLGVSQSFLRTHAVRLGGSRLGKRGHWLFVPSEVQRRLFEGESKSDTDKRVEEWFRTCKI